MAVYTDLTDEEAAALVREFSLGDLQALKGIAEGVENSNFFVQTPEGRFILTIYEKRVRPEDLPFFMAVMETLAEAGFPSPRPLHNRAGGHLASVRGKQAAMVTFLNGVSPTKPNVSQCRMIGEALAKLHIGLRDLPQRRANGLSLTAWHDLVTPRLPLAKELRAGLEIDIAADLEALSASWPTSLPSGVIHADLFPDNALFVGESVGGVIDFYFACNDFWAYDLAICLNAWCFEPRGAFNLTKGQALLAGYASVRKLTEQERTAMPILARGAAMRFFATRLADWLETSASALVKRKDPLEYADRLAFHRRAKGAADYGLE